MAKKTSKSKNFSLAPSDLCLGIKADRNDEIMNSIANVSVILMGTMMGVFTEVMTKAAGAMASGMAQALGGEETGMRHDGEIKQGLSEVDGKMKGMIFDIRKDIYSQMAQKRKEMKPMLSDRAFDVGPKIIENYDFNLPKLSEKLDDDALAGYFKLLASGDPGFAAMFKELTSWINSLPKPPEQMNKKKQKIGATRPTKTKRAAKQAYK